MSFQRRRLAFAFCKYNYYFLKINQIKKELKIFLPSIPLVGSSKQITLGLPTRAIAVDNFLLFPPEKSIFKLEF
jgi:hypothetical protein